MHFDTYFWFILFFNLISWRQKYLYKYNRKLLFVWSRYQMCLHFLIFFSDLGRSWLNISYVWYSWDSVFSSSLELFLTMFYLIHQLINYILNESVISVFSRQKWRTTERSVSVTSPTSDKVWWNPDISGTR